MERRSRSQTRRNDGSGGVGVPISGPNNVNNSSRHASSSRVPETGQNSLSYRPAEQARTLSPDRRDRYRASGRGYPGEGPVSLPPPRPDPHPSGPSSVPHSNSNSYNQYNSQYPLSNGYGELPPPRPHQPYGGVGGSAPPRPEPPSGYQPQQPAPSPSKPPGVEQKPAAASVPQVTPIYSWHGPPFNDHLLIRGGQEEVNIPFDVCLADVCKGVRVGGGQYKWQKHLARRPFLLLQSPE